MDYDPIKDRLAGLLTRTPTLNRAFFRGLDLVFLRAWYVQRALRKLLREMPGDEVRVLDAGTGFGQYAYWLLKEDTRVKVVAADVKQNYLERAERFFRRSGLRDRVRFVQHDLTEPYPDGEAFDVAISVDVLEHIEDDVAVLRHLAAVLRPGGYLVINTPSDQGGSDASPGEEGFIGEHVREGYAQADLAARVEAAGMEVVDWTYTYGRPGSIAWRLLVKTPIAALNRSWLFAPVLVPYYVVSFPLGMLLHALDVRTAKKEGTGLMLVARRRSPGSGG